MLGILLIYFLGKGMYTLAQKHDKGPWPFAILGVVTYYAGTFLAGIVLALMVPSLIEGSDDLGSRLLLSLISVPFGLLAYAILYFSFKNKWEKAPAISLHEDILDEELGDN